MLNTSGEISSVTNCEVNKDLYGWVATLAAQPYILCKILTFLWSIFQDPWSSHAQISGDY